MTYSIAYVRALVPSTLVCSLACRWYTTIILLHRSHLWRITDQGSGPGTRDLRDAPPTVQRFGGRLNEWTDERIHVFRRSNETVKTMPTRPFNSSDKASRRRSVCASESLLPGTRTYHGNAARPCYSSLMIYAAVRVVAV